MQGSIQQAPVSRPPVVRRKASSESQPVASVNSLLRQQFVETEQPKIPPQRKRVVEPVAEQPKAEQASANRIALSAEQVAELLRQQREIENEFIRKQVIENDRCDILAEYVLGYKTANHHLRMIDFQNKKRRGIIVIGRGFGKTTIGTVARSIHEIIKNPNIRILLASKTRGNAQGFLREIKQQFEENKRLKEIFGSYVDEKIWNEFEILCKGRTKAFKEPTISTVGADSAIASRHYDLIICDDFVDATNSSTERQRDKIRTLFFVSLLPTLEPDGRLWLLGTRYHPFDLYGTLIGTDEEHGEYWDHVLHLPVLNQDEKTGEYASIWPEKFSVEYLLEMKRSMGTLIFDSQMQNDISVLKGEIIQWDWMKDYKLIGGSYYLTDKAKQFQKNELKYFQGADLAIGQDEANDFFAHASVGVTPDGDILILDVLEDRLTFSKQKLLIKEKFEKFDPWRVGIEKNGYQKALLLDLRSDEKFSGIRAVGVLTQTDKRQRANKLSAYFEEGRVYFGPGMDWVKKHLLEVPNGKHDDIFDAIDIAINLALGTARAKKQRRVEPGIIRGK